MKSLLAGLCILFSFSSSTPAFAERTGESDTFTCRIYALHWIEGRQQILNSNQVTVKMNSTADLAVSVDGITCSTTVNHDGLGLMGVNFKVTLKDGTTLVQPGAFQDQSELIINGTYECKCGSY